MRWNFLLIFFDSLNDRHNKENPCDFAYCGENSVCTPCLDDLCNDEISFQCSCKPGFAFGSKTKVKKKKKIRQISSFWTQDRKFRNRVKYLCWYQRMHAAGASMSGKCWMCKCWRKLLMCLQRGILWGWRRKLPRFLNPFALIILKIELKWKKKW